MRTSIQTGAAILTAMTTLSLVTTVTQASGNTNYQRNKITKVKAQSYYATRNAKTFRFVGTPRHFKLKANHNLKNFKDSTWTVSKKTTVKHNGKSSLYYYVKNARNGAAGWVWHGYLKKGRNGQMSKAKTVQAKNMVQAKNGKVYQLRGNLQYVRLINGKALSKTVTYHVTKQRYIYKQGTTSLYYYVQGSNGLKGWTWHGYLENKASKNKSTTSKVKKLYSGKMGPSSGIPGSNSGFDLFQWN